MQKNNTMCKCRCNNSSQSLSSALQLPPNAKHVHHVQQSLRHDAALASLKILFIEVKKCAWPAEAEGTSQRTEEAAQGDEKVNAAAVS